MKININHLGIFLLCLLTYSSYSQSITNVNAQLSGDVVNITYNLNADDPNQEFDIRLYSSHNNFSSPLQLVAGDVGRGVRAGTGKRIVWRARDELGTYSGSIQFEVRGNPIGAPSDALTITKPEAGDSFKKGSILPVQWRGGIPNQNIKLELYQNTIMLRDIGTTPNTGNYSWNIPTDLKGSGYNVKLFNVNEPNAAVFSGTFKIKGKLPLAVKLLPIAAAGGVAALLLGGGGGGDGDCQDPCNPNCSNYDPTNSLCTSDLPEPPPPPSGG